MKDFIAATVANIREAKVMHTTTAMFLLFKLGVSQVRVCLCLSVCVSWFVLDLSCSLFRVCWLVCVFVRVGMLVCSFVCVAQFEFSCLRLLVPLYLIGLGNPGGREVKNRNLVLITPWTWNDFSNQLDYCITNKLKIMVMGEIGF